MTDPTRRASATPSFELSALELLSILIRRWKLLVFVPLSVAIVSAGLVLLIPVRYAARTSFVPEAGSDRAGLPAGLAGFAGLASQFGLSLGGGAASPQFYADLMSSRSIRDLVLESRLPDARSAGTSDSAVVLDMLEIEGTNAADRLEKGREYLDRITSAQIDRETGIVRLTVETPYPRLSADLANHYVTLLNRFNLEVRRSGAQERRRFIVDRLSAAQGELQEVEDSLQRFLERNRQFARSPELQFVYERLQRQVSMKQEVSTTLRRQYEEARIQEVNDTPVITVIDRAVVPEEKSFPNRKATVLLAFVLGGMSAVALAFAREFASRAGERNSVDYQTFEASWHAMKREVRGLIGRGDPS